MAGHTVLEKELETFEARRAELAAQDEGKFALICGDHVVGTYVDEQDAIAAGYDQFGNVPFLVVQISLTDLPANFVNDQIDL